MLNCILIKGNSKIEFLFSVGCSLFWNFNRRINYHFIYELFCIQIIIWGGTALAVSRSPPSALWPALVYEASSAVRGSGRAQGWVCASWRPERRRYYTSETGSGASRPSLTVGSLPALRSPGSVNWASSALYSCGPFLYGFQIWRPITATFYFPVSPGTEFLYLLNLYFLYQYSTRLEARILMGGQHTIYSYFSSPGFDCDYWLDSGYTVDDDYSDHVSVLCLGSA